MSSKPRGARLRPRKPTEPPKPPPPPPAPLPPPPPPPKPPTAFKMGSYGVPSIDQHDKLFQDASDAVFRKKGVRVNPRFMKAVMGVESGNNGNYAVDRCRPFDGYPGPPSCGPMQVKGPFHQARCPECDNGTLGGHIELATHIIGDTMKQYGYDEYRAYTKAYLTSDDINGNTQAAVVKKLRESVARMEKDAGEVDPPAGPITFGRVPHPPFQDRIVTNSRAWDDLGPRQIVGVCTHSMIGSLNGTDSYFRGAAAGSALTDYGVGGSTDGALDGVIFRWNDPKGRRAPWANGPANDLDGDGPEFIRAYGVSSVNRDLVSIERSDGGNTETPVSPKQFESIAQLIAYWFDQAKVPWSSYPVNPKSGVVTHMEHWEFGPKQCPFTPMRSRTTELQARVRSILKQYQTGSA